jgi:hypothetical protein
MGVGVAVGVAVGVGVDVGVGVGVTVGGTGVPASNGGAVQAAKKAISKNPTT